MTTASAPLGAPLAALGETFSQRARFSDDAIRAFATSVHDHNPLHHDLAAAKAAGYRALIASGTQLGSVFMAMTATHFAKPRPTAGRASASGSASSCVSRRRSMRARTSSCAGP
jgi:acyl dehydratase